MTTKINSPKRGRPRSFDAENTIDIVKDLFHKQGFDAVGVAEISKATGLNPPSLYSAFGSKFQLLEQAFARCAAKDSAWLDTAISDATSPSDLAATIFQRAADTYTRSPDALGCLVTEATRNSANDEARALTKSYSDRTWQAVQGRLVALGASDPDGMANYILTVMRGLSASARSGMSREALMQVAEKAAAGAVSAKPDGRAGSA